MNAEDLAPAKSGFRTFYFDPPVTTVHTWPVDDSRVVIRETKSGEVGIRILSDGDPLIDRAWRYLQEFFDGRNW